MDTRKLINGIKRVLNNKGKIEIINYENKRLDISNDTLELINLLESLEKDNYSLKSQILELKKSLIITNRMKEFINDFKVRKTMLESNAHFKTILRLYKGKNIDKFIYDGDLSDSEVNLLQLFELIEKLKL